MSTREGVVEVGERVAWELGAGVEDSLSEGFDFDFLCLGDGQGVGFISILQVFASIKG